MGVQFVSRPAVISIVPFIVITGQGDLGGNGGKCFFIREFRIDDQLPAPLIEKAGTVISLSTLNFAFE